MLSANILRHNRIVRSPRPTGFHPCVCIAITFHAFIGSAKSLAVSTFVIAQNCGRVAYTHSRIVLATKQSVCRLLYIASIRAKSHIIRNIREERMASGLPPTAVVNNAMPIYSEYGTAEVARRFSGSPASSELRKAGFLL